VAVEWDGAEALGHAHDRFLGKRPVGGRVRESVLRSWQRSQSRGVAGSRGRSRRCPPPPGSGLRRPARPARRTGPGRSRSLTRASTRWPPAGAGPRPGVPCGPAVPGRLEPPGVDSLLGQPHRVPGCDADQDTGGGAGCPAGFERVAQVRHVDVRARRRAGRPPSSPGAGPATGGR
jgi:hypothetical protein